ALVPQAGYQRPAAIGTTDFVLPVDADLVGNRVGKVAHRQHFPGDHVGAVAGGQVDLDSIAPFAEPAARKLDAGDLPVPERAGFGEAFDQELGADEIGVEFEATQP